MSTLRRWQGVAGSCHLVPVFELRLSDLSDGWHRVPGYAEPLSVWFRAMWFVTRQKNGASALGLQRVLGLGSYRTAWSWLHKLRRAMVRSARDRLAGWVEVDETYLGAPEEGVVGRGVQDKALIVIAAQADGKGIGRIRMRVIQHPSAASLHPFIEDCIEAGSTVHTDAWQGYAGLKKKGYDHEMTSVQNRRPKEVSTLLPRVHLSFRF
jgi:transposase-like protein